MEGESRRWFAMRATYGRNMMAQRTLDNEGVESFIPMRHRHTRSGRRVKIDLVPVVRDLIFVFAEREVLQEQKSKISYLHYITRPVNGRNTPIEVPNNQMEEFIRLCQSDKEVECATEQLDLNIGERVRIVKGALSGIEGHLVKIQGRRARRFTIQIEGVCTAAVEVSKDEIERIVAQS